MAIAAKRFILTRPDESTVTYQAGQKIQEQDEDHWYVQHFIESPDSDPVENEAPTLGQRNNKKK